MAQFGYVSIGFNFHCHRHLTKPSRRQHSSINGAGTQSQRDLGIQDSARIFFEIRTCLIFARNLLIDEFLHRFLTSSMRTKARHRQRSERRRERQALAPPLQHFPNIRVSEDGLERLANQEIEAFLRIRFLPQKAILPNDLSAFHTYVTIASHLSVPPLP